MRYLPLLAWLLLSGFQCTISYFIDPPNDLEFPPPSERQLKQWQTQYESGENWRGDPKRVAARDLTLYLDVPFKYRPYEEEDYEFHNDREEWGPYVTRGWVTRDQNRRYRIRVLPYRDIWYTVQISHYSEVILKHPALEDDD